MITTSVQKHFRSILLLVITVILFQACTKSPQEQDPADKSCRLDSFILTRQYSGNNYTSRTINSYDDQDRVISTKWFMNGSFSGHYQVEYTSGGKVFKITSFEEAGNKREDRVVSYDPQGRISGYDVTAYTPHTTKLQKVKCVYEGNKFLLLGFNLADTIFKVVHHLENGNSVYSEYWSEGVWQTADTTEFGTKTYKKESDPDVVLVASGTFYNKNLHTRKKSFNKIQGNYSADDNYEIELTPEGYIGRTTILTNFPIPNKTPAVINSFYTCD